MRRTFGTWLLPLVLASCGGPHFDGRVYDDGKLRFRVGPVPSSWRTIEADGTLLAFRDDAAGATIAMNGRCGVDGDDVPLGALTQHLFLQFTERDVKEQRELSLDGRSALRTEMVGKLDGVPKSFSVVVLKKDGCVYDFLRVAQPGAGASAEFDAFVQGFATEG